METLRADVDGEPSAIIIDGTVEVPLVTVSLEDLVHTLTIKRRAWREAKSDYSRAGTKVKTLADECDAIVQELERRDELKDSPELPFDDEDDE